MNEYNKKELFKIQDHYGNVIKRIYGVSKEQYNKPSKTNENVKYGKLVLNEEQIKLRIIFDKYSMRYYNHINEARYYEITQVIRETNWKLRVLNERYPV